MHSQCGTPEGFRHHHRQEEPPCPSCRIAMVQLLQGVRAHRDRVRSQMPATIAPLPPFSARQREWWPFLRARDREPLPAIPLPSMPREPCTGDEPWMPSSPRSIAKKARAKGWWVSITRAAGPRIDAKGTVPEGREQVFTIAVAAARGDDRLVWVWKYVEKSVKGVVGWHWDLDDVYWNKQGTINNDYGKRVLDDASG